jgi:hypothetical protein
MTFKLTDTTYTGMDAAGATEVTEFDLGSMFWGHKEVFSFRLGNTGVSGANFEITASGANADIVLGVDFSDNKKDWETSVNIDSLGPNALSDTIWCRFTMPMEALVTSGTFLIHVEED